MTKEETFNKFGSNMYNTKGGVGEWKWRVNAEIIRVITTGSRKPLSNSTSTRNVTR